MNIGGKEEQKIYREVMCLLGKTNNFKKKLMQKNKFFRRSYL